jgi:large subunit ribosomal protein L9
MAKDLQLLLVESVDNLGIVGDVVKVRSGYARNYLLPMGLATAPSEERIKALASKRAEAEKQQREMRAKREQMIEKLEGFEIELVRSCNDQGLLYGSVTQGDIADALAAKGFDVKPREVRLPQTIKRVETHHITVKLDKDLEAEVTVKVVPDRELETDDREEVEVDEEGNMIVKDEKPAKGARGKKGEQPAPAAAE